MKSAAAAQYRREAQTDDEANGDPHCRIVQNYTKRRPDSDANRQADAERATFIV